VVRGPFGAPFSAACQKVVVEVRPTIVYKSVPLAPRFPTFFAELDFLHSDQTLWRL